MKRVRIGGQAVMEGVMMKNGDRYAVAVRKPDKDIEVKVVDYVSMASRSVFFRVPIIRGVVNFCGIPRDRSEDPHILSIVLR